MDALDPFNNWIFYIRLKKKKNQRSIDPHVTYKCLNVQETNYFKYCQINKTVQICAWNNGYFMYLEWPLIG